MHGALLPAALLSDGFAFLAANQSLLDLLSLSIAQMRRRTLFDIVADPDREGARSFADQVSRMRTAARSQREVRLTSGQHVLLVIERVTRRSSPGFLINIVDLSDLITPNHDRAALLEQIKEAAWEWRRTFDAVEMPIIIVGPELDVVRINRAARMLVGKSYNEIIGSSLHDLPAAEPWLSVAALTSQVQDARAPAARQVKDPSGRTLDLLAMLFNIDDAADQRVIVIVWDVSALVDLQSRLEQQRQMAAMGALVAGVAHEVRNPLFAISATIDAMEQTAPPALREYFEVLREEIDRMTKLMQDLLAYGRPAAPVFADVLVSEVVDVAVRASSAAAKKSGVEIDVEHQSDALIVADRDRLSRAIENLIMNAIQHSPAGAVVTVRSKRGEIRVIDQGKGFATQDLPRVFEPFFSRRKGGTGLGLALVHQIVTEHGGEVVAKNRASGGAEVVISIPAKSSR
ncbi:MAG TPA: ATP-binding protein [Thermoanaerobaculia bacterium]|nr:ATP-binding protein [Thermoanaerobaculia bacterium]